MSLNYQIAPGVATIYFPVALGFAMIRWWGYRILPALYLNAVLSSGLWGLTKLQFFPLYGLPDVIEVWASYMLVKERFKDTKWSPAPTDMILYGIHGILIPSALAAFVDQGVLFFTGVSPTDRLVWQGLSSFIGDLMGGVGAALPLLIVLTPYLEKKNLNIFRVADFELQWKWKIPFKEKVVLACGFGLALLLSVALPVFRTWYFMGIFVLLPAIWYGLEFSIIVNTFIAFLSLTVPTIAGDKWPQTLDSLQIVATLLTLCFTALVAGS
ncbi:MAG TPA: hypothetical protein VN132_07085, partial [Bdellovibrio sp.]|nr:hypothetical protein [Bdellovibrio sp.]